LSQGNEALGFWNVHRGTTVNDVGHAEAFDAARVEGSLANLNARVRYIQAGKTLAEAIVGRDPESPKAGLALDTAPRPPNACTRGVCFGSELTDSVLP
jgi:hypothetical protein